MSQLNIVSPRRLATLTEAGIDSAGDLWRADLDQAAHHHGWSPKTRRRVRRVRKAIALAASLPGMMPREALLLMAIHRRDAKALAADHAGLLRRDLERFALSSRGAKLKGRHKLPSTARLKRWIQRARVMQERCGATSTATALTKAR